MKDSHFSVISLGPHTSERKKSPPKNISHSDSERFVPEVKSKPIEKKNSPSKTRDISSTVNKTTTTWRAAPTYRSLSCNLLTGQKAGDFLEYLVVWQRGHENPQAERLKGHWWKRLRLPGKEVENPFAINWKISPKANNYWTTDATQLKFPQLYQFVTLCQVKSSRKLFLVSTCLHQVWTWWLSRCGFNGVQKGWRGQWIGWWPPSPNRQWIIYSFCMKGPSLTFTDSRMLQGGVYPTCNEADFSSLNQVSLLDFPWVLDYILATRFNCSLRQIRHAVCSIVRVLRDMREMPTISGCFWYDLLTFRWSLSMLDWTFVSHFGVLSETAEVFGDIGLYFPRNINELKQSQSSQKHPKRIQQETSLIPNTVDGRNPAPVDMVVFPLFTRF